MKRLGMIIAVMATFAALLATSATVAGAESEERTYRVTVTNNTDFQPFTPPNFVTHGNERVFQNNTPASAGIQAVAENGQPGVLNDEWEALGLNSFVAGPAEGAPGPIFSQERSDLGATSRTFEITSSDSRYSLVTMIICTNDGFGGVNSKRLPNRIGQTTRDVILAHDAGTEINTQNDADLVPAPFCGDPGVGTGVTNPALAEDGVIRGHRGIVRNVGDIPQMYDFTRAVGEVVIERIG